MPQQALGERLARISLHLRVLPSQTVDTLGQCHVSHFPPFLLQRFRTLQAGLRLIVEGANRCCPRLHGGIRTRLCLEGMAIAQQMYPAALMLPSIDGVAPIKVTDEVPLEPTAQQALDDGSGTAWVIRVGAHRIRARRTQRPAESSLPRFAPARLVSMQHGTRPRAGFEVLHSGRCAPPHLMEEGYDFAIAEGKVVQGPQLDADPADGQAQGGAEGCDQARDAHAHPALSQHLTAQVEVRRMPAFAVRAPPLNHVMFDDLDRLRRRQLNHLAAAAKAHAMELEPTIGTALQYMPLDASRRCESPGTIVLRLALTAGLPFALGRLGFAEGGRRGCLVLQCSHALFSNGKPFQGLRQLLFQQRVLRPKPGDFILKRHAAR